jgi:hypothetical protein
MAWSVGRSLIASLRYFRLPSLMVWQLERERNRIMHSNIYLPLKIEVDGVECRKSLHCFTQVLYAFIIKVLAPKK